MTVAQAFHRTPRDFLLAEEPDGDYTWTVQFHVIDADETHELVIKRQRTAEKRLVSCSTPKEKAVERYELVERVTK